MKFLASKGFNEKEMADKIKNSEELKVDEESKLVHHNIIHFSCSPYISPG